ncbi:MAG: D-glycerate dehydrogenase [Parcubacteria group bacterium]|jgi:glyoxylate reductase|nr:D-glycerate dehydrogenase [Parcubacteria group bacterium]
MPKVFITRQIPEIGIKLLKDKGYDVSVGPEGKISKQELLDGVKGVDAILSVLTEKIDGSVMDAAGQQLKIVANYAVGYNNLDLEAAKERKVVMTNTPGVLTDTVADHTVTLLLSIARRVVEADKYTRAGQYQIWGPKLFLGGDLVDKVLGIVGLGRIGFAVAERMKKGFNMKVIYYDIKRNQALEEKHGLEYRELDQLLSEADFISLHTALTDETRHLINAERLKLIKLTSYLINTSRGPIIDEKALVEVLKDKKIAGAALDVFEKEPELMPGLAKLDNVIITPHIASATKGTRNKMAQIAANNVIAALEGETPPNLIK